jgi:CBS domain-containing protein
MSKKKLDQAVEKVIKAGNGKAGAAPYMVMMDSQGVGYLRVEETAKGARLLTCTGKKVEVVEMDATTMRSRSLTATPEASVLDAAKILAVPITAAVVISDRAKKYLDAILADKDLVQAAATKKKAAVAAPAAKGEKPAKVAKAPRVLSGPTQTITLVKMAKDGDLPKQAIGILQILKPKPLTVAELTEAMTGKIETKQPMSAIWGFYRGRLTKEGYVSIA